MSCNNDIIFADDMALTTSTAKDMGTQLLMTWIKQEDWIENEKGKKHGKFYNRFKDHRHDHWRSRIDRVEECSYLGQTPRLKDCFPPPPPPKKIWAHRMIPQLAGAI